MQFFGLFFCQNPNSELVFEFLIEFYIDYNGLEFFFIHFYLSVIEKSQSTKNCVKTPIFAGTRIFIRINDKVKTCSKVDGQQQKSCKKMLFFMFFFLFSVIFRTRFYFEIKSDEKI